MGISSRKFLAVMLAGRETPYPPSPHGIGEPELNDRNLSPIGKTKAWLRWAVFPRLYVLVFHSCAQRYRQLLLPSIVHLFCPSYEECRCKRRADA
jgi:hypothetical protein